MFPEEKLGHKETQSPSLLSFKEQCAELAKKALKIMEEKKGWVLYGYSRHGGIIQTHESEIIYSIRRKYTLSSDHKRCDIGKGMINWNLVHITEKNIHLYPTSYTKLFNFTDAILEHGNNLTVFENDDYSLYIGGRLIK
jgi:hypothetical protein